MDRYVKKARYLTLMNKHSTKSHNYIILCWNGLDYLTERMASVDWCWELYSFGCYICESYLYFDINYMLIAKATTNEKLNLTFQAFSRLWSVFSVLTFSANELSNSACCIRAVIFGSSFLRNDPWNLLFCAAGKWH